jgi:hypothetical protein
LLLLDEPQLQVFHSAAPVLLNRDCIAPNEVDILTHASLQKYSNIRTFQAQFIPDLLRIILPSACFTGTKAAKTDLQPAQYEAMCGFLRVFWKYSSTRAEVVTAIKEGAAVVPVVGLDAFYPLSRMSNLLVRQKGDVALSAEIVEILRTLGVQFVDQLALPEVSMM